jgi:hypothetical protein
MKKQNKKISLLSFVLFLMILILSFFTSSLLSNQQELEEEILSLKSELEQEQDMEKVSELTKEFIEKSSEAKHGDLLTGQAKKDFKEALEKHGAKWDYHGGSVLENMEVRNVFAIRTGDNKARSYAIYQVAYANNPDSDEITTQRILNLTLIAEWDKTKNGYKVEEYKIELLKDSLDEYMNQLSKESEVGEKVEENS